MLKTLFCSFGCRQSTSCPFFYEDDQLMEDDNGLQRPCGNICLDVEGFRRLGDPAFQMNFRMSKVVFQSLVLDVGNHLVNKGDIQRLRTPLYKTVLMVLWILGNTDTFRSAALHFGVDRETLHFHYRYIIQALREMAPVYIQWPTREERQETKAFFQESHQYPGVVGCMDGMHSYISAPLSQKHAYVNKHHTYSIATQAVCDHNMLIRDLYVGEPGSMHDARIFRRSPLSTNLLEKNTLLEDDEHLLGDGAYMLTDKVMVPYDDNGVLTQRQRGHNLALSRIRSTIERTFGLLNNKFRRLRHFFCARIEYAVDHIAACFVLHNYIILSGEGYGADYKLEVRVRDRVDKVEEADFNPDEDGIDVPDFPAVAHVEVDHPLLPAARAAGIIKRERE